MNRRGFLGAMLGAAMAPAVVKAENLMKIIVPAEKKIFVGRGMTSPIWTLDDAAFISRGAQSAFGETFFPTLKVEWNDVPDLPRQFKAACHVKDHYEEFYGKDLANRLFVGIGHG